MHPNQKIILGALSGLVVLVGIYTFTTGKMFESDTLKVVIPTPTPQTASNIVDEVGSLVEEYGGEEIARSLSGTSGSQASDTASIVEALTSEVEGSEAICTFSHTEASGVMYVDNGKIRVDTDVDDANTGSVLFLSEGVYVWETSSSTGIFMGSDNSLLSPEALLSDTLDNYNLKTNDIVQTCKAAEVDDSLFIVPENITFLNYGVGEGGTSN